MKTISIDKKCHSILVVRQALYWLSGMTEWSLDEKDKYWEVTFRESNDDILFNFNRLLNDYELREQIELKTKDIRISIINKVLASLDERLSK